MMRPSNSIDPASSNLVSSSPAFSSLGSFQPLLLISAGLASVGSAVAGGVLAGVVYLSVEVEYQRFADPTGRYEAVVMVPRGALLMPFLQGSGGDAVGSVQFFDVEGNLLGSQPIERVGDVFVEWDSAGRAYVGSAGNLEEWELGEGDVAIA